MITCTFGKAYTAYLRHVVTHAIVEKDGCLLLVKRSLTIPEPGKWSFPGGYLDRDETVREGVLRELQEETGWDGEVISLFRINSNPHRPHEDTQNVAFEYMIKPVSKVKEPDEESTQIQWFPIEKLPASDQIAFDHDQTIKLYLKYREKPCTLPIIE